MCKKMFFDNIETMENKSIIKSQISKLSLEEQKYINENIVSMLNGLDYESKNTIEKKQLYEKIISRDQNKKIGLISEFFMLLIIRQNSFEQAYCYNNLEEGSSLKKAFDGLFIKDNEIWLVESKSTMNDKSHKTTIGIAHRDMKKRIEGSKDNNPWKNAYHHAKSYDSSKETLIKKLNLMSVEYSTGTFQSIENQNVILVSSIFNIDEKQFEGIIECIEKHEYKKEIIIALQILENILLEFLEGE